MVDEAGFEEKAGKIPNGIRFRTNGDKNLRLRKGPRPISEIEEQPIEWFWEPYIPLGKLTILGGDPGAGKSFITTALSATVSKGECFPGDKVKHEAGNVLMLSVEDDPADTIKPRLRNLHADMTRIFVSEEDIVLDEDGLNAIRIMIKQTSAKLVIIDPIVAFLGPKMDMNRANEVRHIMKAVAKIAKDFNIAILVVRHNRKEGTNGSNGKAIYNGMGSIDFTASVRSELAVVTSPNGTHFLNHIKVNSGPKGKSITYSITSLLDGSGLFEWGEFANWPPGKAGGGAKISKKFKDDDKVRAWLFDLLKNHPDGLSSNDVYTMGELKGYGSDKIKRAKIGMAKVTKRSNGWYYDLDRDSTVELDASDVVD